MHPSDRKKRRGGFSCYHGPEASGIDGHRVPLGHADQRTDSSRAFVTVPEDIRQVYMKPLAEERDATWLKIMVDAG